MTPQQQMYAATDAWVCIKIYEKLMATQPIKPLPNFEIEAQPQAPKPKSEKRPWKRVKYSRKPNTTKHNLE